MNAGQRATITSYTDAGEIVTVCPVGTKRRRAPMSLKRKRAVAEHLRIVRGVTS